MHPTEEVLAEDRLLWEFWLNHGLDGEALRRRWSDLPEGANGDYLASNSLYGGFEEGLLRLARESRALNAAGVDLEREIRSFLQEATGQGEAWGAEARLLSALSLQPAPGGPEAEEAAARAGEVRAWGRFLRAACRSNLVLPVARSLEDPEISARFPERARTGLIRAAEGIRSRNERLLELLRRILDAYAAAGLNPMLLKESALFLDLYPEAGDRMVGDLDLLFPGSEIDPAEKLLIDLGYVPFEGIWSRAWYRAHHHHLAPLVSAGEAVKIEPHQGIWIPTGSSSPIIPEILAASGPHPALPARRPSATHLAFHLLIDFHGNASIGKLGQMSDAARFLRERGAEVDTAGITDLARRTGSLPFLQDSLHLMRTVYGAGFMAAAAPGLAGLAGEEPVSLERRMLRRLALRNLPGFEPETNLLSVAGVRLLHKALIRPGSRLSRIGYVLRSLVAGKGAEEGAGPLARRSQGSVAHRAIRLVTSPFRIVARGLKSGRR